MISRGAAGAHICWRCQLRLSSRSLASRLHLQATRLQHDEALSNTIESSNARTRNLEGSRSDHGRGITRATPETKLAQDFKRSGAWRPLQKKHVTELPLGRLHGFRGHRLREKRAELNIDCLGTPAEVIVLRDAGFRSKPLPNIEELEAPERVDILKQLDAERGLVTQADVEKNIDDCRPKTNTIGWTELQQILRQLASGFTALQLTKYIDSSRHRQKKVEEESESGTSEGPESAIIRKSSWVPAVSETGVDFGESSLQGYDSEAFTPKQRLALLILRQCWQIEAQEVIESLGMIELEIASAELELLIEGRDPPLKVISNEFIANQEEKIEAFRSRGVVRITATREKSENIFQAIRAALRDIRSLEIDLNALVPGLQSPKDGAKSPNETILDETSITELARLTETNIARLPDNRILISCIHAKPETQLSTKADVARRLLLTSSDLACHTKTLIACKEIMEPLIAVTYHMKDGMSWRDRLRHWVRWTSATSKIEQPHKSPEVASIQRAAKVLGTVHKNKLEKPSLTNSVGLPSYAGLSQDEVNQGKVQADSKVPGDSYWDSNTFTETSAIVGHILHDVHTPGEISTKSAKPAHLAKRAVFQPAPMNISRLIGSIPLMNDLNMTSLVLRFIPSPWTVAGPKVLSSLPPVEMCFAVDPNTKELHLDDVVAVVESTASDVMLPDRILDLRFQQRTTAQLRTLHRQQLPQILEFLETSQLNLTSGRLETPPGIVLPISHHLCNGPISDALQKSGDESINADYIFGGLEYRSTLALNFRGWQLLYTSIEGGTADGRRAELSLRPRRVLEDASDSKKTSTIWNEEYIETAYRLVHALTDYDTAPSEAPSISTKAYDQDKPSGLSYNTVRVTNKDFQYFRESVNFVMNHGMENEGSIKEVEAR